MEEQEQLTLAEIKAQLNENTVMLKQILKQNKIALYSKLAYWGFLVLLTVGAFALLQPLFSSLGNVYGGGLNFGDTTTIQKLQAEFSDLE